MAKSGSPKMKLYWQPMTRAVRIIWLIKEMGVEDDFELIKYNPNTDATADAAYRKDVHPHGTVPALVIPGRPPLLESGAICMYLADKYGKLVPDPKDRADYYDFVIYGNATLDDLLNFYYLFLVLKQEYTKEMQETMKKKFNSCMEYLARRLEGQKYLCGEELTTADCVVGYDLYLATLINDGVLLENHPKVRDYYDRLKDRECFRSTINMS